MTGNHELFTQMLFVDAICGVGMPTAEVGMAAEVNELADCVGNQHSDMWAWRRTALEALPTSELQDLYTHLKTYEVTHAD